MMKAYGEIGNLPPPRLKTCLTHPHKDLRISDTYKPAKLLRVDKGFCFCACAILRTFCLGYFSFLDLPIAWSVDRAPILIQKTPKDAVPHKAVPFGGREGSIYNFNPFYFQNRQSLI